MSSQEFTLKIITPSGPVLEEKVHSVTLPSKQGEIGVLPQHVKYTGLLGVGILRFSLPGSSSVKSLVVGGGFCNFDHDTLVILADSVDSLESVNKDKYGTKREDLSQALKAGSAYETNWHRIKDELERVEAIDRLLVSH